MRQREAQVALKQKGRVTICDSAVEHSLHWTHLRRENLPLLLLQEENRSALCWDRMGHLLRVALIDQCSSESWNFLAPDPFNHIRNSNNAQACFNFYLLLEVRI